MPVMESIVPTVDPGMPVVGPGMPVVGPIRPAQHLWGDPAFVPVVLYDALVRCRVASPGPVP